MESNSQSDPEQLVQMCNSFLPHYSTSLDDISNPKPIFLLGLLSEILQLLGVNKDSILSTKVEGVEDNHTEYYADLVPAINMTRALNHILEPFEGNVCLFDIVYPHSIRVQPLLRLLFTMCLFVKDRQEAINDRVQKLYESKDEIDRLNNENNLLLIEVNEAVAAKASRPGRMRKVSEEIEVLQVKLREETALKNKELAAVRLLEKKYDEGKAKIALIKKENDILEEQLAEKEAKILPNAADLKVKRDQVVREEKELSELVESKKSVLWTKKNTASNLDTVNKIFQEALNLLDSFMSAQESLKGTDAIKEEVETKIKSTKEDLDLLSNEMKMIQGENIKLDEHYQCRLQEILATLQEASNDAKLAELQHANISKLKARHEEYKQTMQSKRTSYESQRQSLMEDLISSRKLCTEKLAAIEDMLTGEVDQSTTLMITKLRNLFDGNK